MADINIRLSQLVTFLETYRGRDKVIRLLNYAAYIASGLLQRLRGKDNDFTTGRLAAELSNLRVMLRLIDDFSMLQYSLSYGIGKHVCNINYSLALLMTLFIVLHKMHMHWTGYFSF